MNGLTVSVVRDVLLCAMIKSITLPIGVSCRHVQFWPSIYRLERLTSPIQALSSFISHFPFHTFTFAPVKSTPHSKNTFSVSGIFASPPKRVAVERTLRRWMSHNFSALLLIFFSTFASPCVSSWDIVDVVCAGCKLGGNLSSSILGFFTTSLWVGIFLSVRSLWPVKFFAIKSSACERRTRKASCRALWMRGAGHEWDVCARCLCEWNIV